MIAIALEHIKTVVDRLTQDKAFRVKYCQDPDTALESYLTPEEIQAIKTGDGHRLGLPSNVDTWEKLTAVLCGPDPGP